MFDLLLPAAKPLERLAGRGVQPVRQCGPLPFRVLDRREVAEERLRRTRLNHPPSGRSHGRVAGDDAHTLPRAILARQALDQGVGVLDVANVEWTAGLVLSRAVEDEHATCALRCNP